MKLQNLKLENFRQHVASDINFQDGMTVITGLNGTGKTTVLEGVTFALYGEQRQGKDSIAFAFSDTKKFAVTLTFEIDGTAYECYRSNKDAHLKNLATNVLVAESLSETTRQVEKLLGLTYEQFVNSFCCQQKGLEFLNFKNNADRQKEISKMMGYERLERAETLAKDKRKTANAKVEALTQTLGDRAGIEAQLKEAEETLTGIDAEILTLEQDIKEIEAVLPTYLAKSNSAKEWQRISGLMAGIAATVPAHQSAINSAKAEQDAATEAKWRYDELAGIKLNHDGFKVEVDAVGIEAAHASMKAIVDEFTRARQTAAQRQELTGKIEESTRKIAELEEKSKTVVPADVDLQPIQGEINQLTDSLTARQQELDRRKSDRAIAMSVANLKLEQLPKAIAEVQAKINAGVCPECGQPVSGTFTDRLTALQNELKEGQARKAELDAQVIEDPSIAEDTARLNELKTNLETARTQNQNNVTARLSLSSVQTQLADAKNLKATQEQTLATLPASYDADGDNLAQARLKELDPLLTEYRQLAGSADRLTRAKAAYDTAIKSAQQSRDEYEELAKTLPQGLDAESASQAISAYQDKTNDLAILNTSKTAKLATKELAGKQVKNARESLKSYDEKTKDLSLAKTLVQTLDTVAIELKNLRLNLNQQLAPELSAAASEILTSLTNGRYSVIDLDDKFTPTLVDDGVSKSVISGGEEDVRDIALRLGLAKLIQERQGRPMSLLILDEVFGSLDASRRQAVLDALIALKGLFSQIIVISHVEGTSEIADNVISLSRDGETRGTIVGRVA